MLCVTKQGNLKMIVEAFMQDEWFTKNNKLYDTKIKQDIWEW